MLIVAVIAAALFFFFIVGRFRPHKKGALTPAEPVLNVLALQPQNVTIDNSYIGYITPINSVDVLPFISGFLEDIMVSGGQEVTQGDNLWSSSKMNTKPTSSSLKQNCSKLKPITIMLPPITSASKPPETKLFLPQSSIWQKHHIFRLKQLLPKPKPILELVVNYNYTVIQAPISGMVGDVSLSRGDYVSPASQPLFKIIQYNPIRVVFSISDKEYLNETHNNQGAIFAGKQICLRLADGEIYTVPGQYGYMNNELDKSTSSISIYADFANPQKQLVANSYVDVLIAKTYIGVLRLRQNYVSREDNGNFVYTVLGNQLQNQLRFWAWITMIISSKTLLPKTNMW